MFLGRGDPEQLRVLTQRFHAGWRLPDQPKKSRPLMNESVRTTLKYPDPGDGSGDVIVDLPDDKQPKAIKHHPALFLEGLIMRFLVRMALWYL